MSWLWSLLAGSGLAQALAAVLAALGALWLALAGARRSGRREAQAEAQAAQDRATLDTVRRRDKAAAQAPKTGDAALERLRRGDA